MKRLIAVSFADGSADAYSVFNADYYLVTSDTLTFTEAVFHTEIGDVSRAEILAELTRLGYEVEELNATIVVDNGEFE